jgi:hypothetical protein
LSTPQPQSTRRIVHVSRRAAGESLRAARALKELEGVTLLGVCEGADGADTSEVFDELVYVEDVHDAERLIAAARTLAARHGAVTQLVTAQETLLEAVARANEALTQRGMDVATVRRALDKSQLKRALERAGVGTARDCLVTCDEDARRFARESGYPLVLKPLSGSGGLATWRIRGAEQLELALALMRPSAEKAVLAEECLRGQELCIDTITIANEPRFHSLCLYRPSILEALEDPRVQWTCVMPRDIGGERFREFIRQGLAATRALAVGSAMTHMEGFLSEDGTCRFTDATLRPAGARIGPMLGFAYDIDPYRAWARAAVDGCFDGPWERRYAVGTIFLRGTGDGTLERVDGLEEAKRRAGEFFVDWRLPRVGSAKSATYTGDGYVTVRHAETRAVEEVLQLISRTVSITYSGSEAPSPPDDEALAGQWSRRLGYFDMQLNKPAWEDDPPLKT